MTAGRTFLPGDCTATCQACGAPVVVPPIAGLGPWLHHEPDCPRAGQTIHEAAGLRSPHWKP